MGQFPNELKIVHSESESRKWRARPLQSAVAVWPKANMKVIRSILVVFSLLLLSVIFCSLIGSAALGQPQSASENNITALETVVLQNATIRTVAGQGSFVGTIVLRDGKIAEINKVVEGEKPLPVPTGATAYDLTGQVVTPGLIDSNSVLWLTDLAKRESSSTAALDIIDGIDPWQQDWQEVSAQGVTTVFAEPNGTLGGYGAVFNVGPASNKDEIVLSKEVAVSSSIGLTGATSISRRAEFEKLKAAIKKIVDKNEEEEKKVEEEESDSDEDEEEKPDQPTPSPTDTSTTNTSSNVRTVTPPDRTKDLLTRVVNGELPLRIRVQHSDAIGWALSLQEEFGIRIVLEGLSQAGRSSKSIIEKNIPVIFGPISKLSGRSTLVEDSNQDWVAQYAEQGRLLALGTFSDSPRGSRLLRVEAARAICELNLSRDEALKAITLNAARILGVADQVGSIEVGKRADLAIFAGEPLDPSVPCTMVFSRGKVIHQLAFDAKIAAETYETPAASEIPSAFPESYALKSTRILTKGKFGPGVVVVQNGEIKSVGEKVPADLRLFDLKDAVITPGLVVAHTNLGQQSALLDDSESDATHLIATYVFDSGSDEAMEMLKAGFIHAGFAPASLSTSSGAIGQVKLGADAPIIEERVATKFVLSGAARNSERYPTSLTGQFEMLNDLLNNKVQPTNLYVSSPIARAMAAEKLSTIESLKKGDLKSLIQVNNDLEFRHALRLAKLHKLSGAIFSTANSVERFDQLKQSRLSLIVDSASGLEYDRYYSDVANAAIAGIPLAFAGDDAERIRTTAALIAAAGAPQDIILRGLTSAGAEAVGMERGTGEMSVGGSADFVIWNGSPLDLSSKPMGVVVDGKLIK